MKIGIVQPRTSYFTGGAEKISLEHCKYLSRNGHDTTLYTLDHPKCVLNSSEEYVIKKLPVPKKFQYLYDITPGENRFRWDMESLFFSQMLMPELTEDSPDIAISYYLPDLTVRPSNLKTLLYLLGYTTDYNEMRKPLLHNHDALVAISPKVRDEWAKYDSHEVIDILPTGVEVNLDDTTGITFDYNKTNIVFAGRLIERKGIKLLSEVASNLNKNGQNIKVHVFGDGPLKDYVLKQSSMKYHGLVSNIAPYLSKADFCVFPSIAKEGLMGVVLEAMASGSAVITTLNNGNEVAISNGSDGILIPPNSKSAIEESILKFIRDPALVEKIKKNAIKKSKDFSWPKHIEHLENILARVCND